MATHRVLLVEDDEHTRQRLARIVGGLPALSLVAEVGTLADARTALATLHPTLLLVDLGLPDGEGAQLIREACTADDVQAMVITVFGDEQHVVNAIRAGATGYLLKDAGAQDIGRAITDLLAGGSPISPSVARYLLSHVLQPLAAPAADPLPRFSGRESDILNLVAKGLAYAEIGHALGISINTVGTHIKQIYRKLSVSSRGEAVYEAGQLGMLEDQRQRLR